MIVRLPAYCESFRCSASECSDNCCIGWEIDIDEKSLDLYSCVTGEFGERLKENISFDGTPHFVLKKDERCPFLNGNNLCDIYATLGEHNLCQICADHPRFYNELDDRVEAGLGLCCEEAARLIITKKEPTKLVGNTKSDDPIIELRNKALEIISDRLSPVPRRLENLMMLFGIKYKPFNISAWAEVFENLERLDEKWTELLFMLKTKGETCDFNVFDAFMKGRETEYEQLLCYLIYRHLAKAEFIEDAALYAAFAVLSYELIYNMGAVLFTEKGDFSVAEQIDLLRIFSSEIEYSDENLDIILNTIYKEL